MIPRPDSRYRSGLLILLVIPLLTGAAAASSGWESLGPDGAGLTLDIVVDPTDPNILYLAGGRGVYKSTDRGLTWQLASRGLTSSGVFSLAINPATTSDLYAIDNDRVWKSTDGAASWFPANCGLTGNLRRIDVDRQNPSTLYVATSQGAFKSTNGALSWQAINTGLTDLNLRDLRVAPSRGATIYVATIDGGVFRSRDGGASWQAANTGLSDPRITMITVSPDDDQFVLAGGFGGLSKTSNGGDNWESAQTGLAGGTPFSLAFTPGNDSIVYAGTVIDGIYKSTNRAGSWSAANNGVAVNLANFGITAMTVDPQDASRVYATTLDGGPGVFVSSNAGAQWNASGTGLNLHRVLEIVADPVNSQILYAAMDNRNGVYKSTDGGVTWSRMNSGFRDEFGLFDNLPLSLAMDPRNRNILYLGSNGDGMFKSVNGAASWERLPSNLLDNRFVTKVIVDPVNSNVLYAASSDGGVLKSSNAGASWSATGGQISAIVEDLDVDPSQNSRVYAVTGRMNEVFLSTNGGTSWTQIANGLNGARPVEMALDPNNPSILYLATRAGGVFKSTDRGATWETANIGLLDLAVTSLVAGPGVAYAGTAAQGVFRSRNGGQTWTRAANGLLGERIPTLTIDPEDVETVYAGTDAQGLFKRVAQPAYLYAAGRVDNRPQFDGLAFSNYSLEAAALELDQVEARVSASSEVDTQDSPAGTSDLLLEAGQQAARTRTQLFPGSSNLSAWIEQSADVSELASFFQFGSNDLSQLDGGVAATEPMREFLFTRVFEGDGAFRGRRATTRFSIFNPNPSAVTVQLAYFTLTSPPGPPVQQLVRDIPARGFLEGTFSQFFQTGSMGGYIRGEVMSGDGVVAYELVQLPDDQTILGLNAARLNQPGRSYSAQLASQPGIFTNLNLVNTSGTRRQVTLTAIGSDGSVIGQPEMLTLESGQQYSADAGMVFASNSGVQPALAVGFVGSLVAEADGDGVVGDVIFGDPDRFRFAAALPLQSEAFTEAVFSQVANVPGFFTGLAFFFPGSPFEGACGMSTTVTIEVIRADGTLAGTGERELQAGERLSQLVDELVAASAGQAGGYIRIRSTQALIAQMLFGALDSQGIRLFSAVPPRVIQ